ncbi:MAG: hypothetical protein IPN71_13010 [Fibrobacteres bacterium]|jgi:hypothetical protein|nr:hypothetical protein [Fibrobacterota bacterium]MBK8802946.1 hypothetical protein [Fibrobacterota bacterium]
MSRAYFLSLLSASVVVADVPVTFFPGNLIKADEVNKNFHYVDSSVGKKASQASLDAVAEALKNKVDASALSAKILTKDLAVSGGISATKMSVGGMILQHRAGSTTIGTIYGGDVDTLKATNYGLYIAKTGVSAYLNGTMQVGLDINNDDILIATADNITAFKPISGTSATFSGSVRSAAGAIKASDVADYVFEPDYKLASLSEVEAYAKANKHLPDVPSAAQIEQDGLDLAKMNLLLLKKVEELTLHTISLEKRIKTLETKD